MVIALADGGSVPADHAFLTTGYTGNAAPHIDALITEPYPLPERLAAIAPGQSVAVGGFGLSAMDVISCLTAGRGGRYRRDQGDPEYLPSGAEPRIVLYSRSGVPCRARPLVTRFEISYDPLVFTRPAVDALRDTTGALDFHADIMPLILTEMRIAYRRCQARCEAPEAEQALVAELRARDTTHAVNARLDELDAARGRFDAAATFDGSAGIRLGDGAAYQRWFADTLRRDLGEGLLGFAWSPVKAALDIFRELRDTVRYVADFAGLTPTSRDAFYRRVVPLMNRAVVGPQYERHAELLALMDAGLVEVPLGPAPAIAANGDRWTLTSTCRSAARSTGWCRPRSRCPASRARPARCCPRWPVRAGSGRPIQAATWSPASTWTATSTHSTRTASRTRGSGSSARCARARRSTTTWSPRPACTRARSPTPTAAPPPCSPPQALPHPGSIPWLCR
jgi:hypothetical protein